MAEMMDWLMSAFGDMGSELGDMFGSGDGESGNLMKGVKGALKLGMLGSAGGKAHSNVQATPFHYQSNANPITALKTGFDYMKNDINVGQGFNDVKNLF